MKGLDVEEGLNEFEAGYSDDEVAVVEKQEPLAEDVTEEKVEEPTEAVKQEEEKPDPLKEILTRFDKLEGRTRSVEGHIGGLTSRLKSMNEQMDAAKVAASAVSEAPTAGQMKEASESPKEWESLKEDFPEWAQATEKLLDSRMGKSDSFEKILEQKLKGMTDEFTAKTQEIRHEAALEALYVAFPDWESDARTPEFAKWYETQDEKTQELSKSTRPADAAKMMRAFYSRKPDPVEESRPDPSAARRERLRAAVTPKGTGGSTPANSDIDDMMAGYTG